MDILWIVLIIIGAYFFLIFVGIRLVVPFMGFGRFRMPDVLPGEIKNKISELENQSASPLEYLQAAYDFVTSRWYMGRMTTILKVPAAFRSNLKKIWQQPGFAHCHTQNYVLFVLLAGSKFFKPEDINTQCVFFNMFIHQYLKVKIGDSVIAADPAGASIRGKKLGEYIEWFG